MQIGILQEFRQSTLPCSCRRQSLWGIFEYLAQIFAFTFRIQHIKLPEKPQLQCSRTSLSLLFQLQYLCIKTLYYLLCLVQFLLPRVLQSFIFSLLELTLTNHGIKFFRRKISVRPSFIPLLFTSLEFFLRRCQRR